MTFIASVVAKKGVALIADSLVTSQAKILSYHRLLDYLKTIKPKGANGSISIDSDKLLGLFTQEPMYTKDYEEKLFKLTDSCGITTCGTAYINDKSISDIVEEFKASKNDLLEASIPIEEKFAQMKLWFNSQILEHLKSYTTISTFVLIVTNYDKHTHTTKIFKTIVHPTYYEEKKIKEGHDFFNDEEIQDWVKVVCDGQNKISETILYGFGREYYTHFSLLVKKIIEKLKIKENEVPENFIEKLRDDPYFQNIFFGDLQLLNLNNLSLQQAVDLACLLMRLEVDFQKYTKNIPTVGGVIKLAVIDEDGFRFLAGNNIDTPKHINN